MHVAAKIGIGVGLVAGTGLLLAACGKKDPSQVPNDLFKSFDKNGDGVHKNEAVKRFERTSTDRTYGLRIGDHVQYTDTIKQTTWGESMLRAVNGADKNKDALASWSELTDLAKTFDRDADGQLNGKERGAFKDQYGVQTIDRQVRILGQSSGLEYRPRHDHNSHDHYPSTGGGGRTSDGDDRRPSGGGGGSTGPGDSPGYRPPSGGGGSTGPGDSGGSSGPSRPSNGNSTDNGNPSESDF